MVYDPSLEIMRLNSGGDIIHRRVNGIDTAISELGVAVGINLNSQHHTAGPGDIPDMWQAAASNKLTFVKKSPEVEAYEQKEQVRSMNLNETPKSVVPQSPEVTTYTESQAGQTYVADQGQSVASANEAVKAALENLPEQGVNYDFN